MVAAVAVEAVRFQVWQNHVLKRLIQRRVIIGSRHAAALSKTERSCVGEGHRGKEKKSTWEHDDGYPEYVN